MKKIIFLTVIAIFSSMVSAQTGKPNSLGGLIFSVDLNKTSYLPFEPIFVKFKISNLTKQDIKVDAPQFLSSSGVRITKPDGKAVDLTGLSLSTGGGVNLPGGINVLQPLQSFEEVEAPAINPEVLAEPGIYQLQFFLDGLKSNVCELEIVTPQGLNKEAFDFLTKHGRDIWFGRMLQEKDGNDLLGAFVQKFGGSDYGVYGITSLGKYYLNFEKNLDKAEAQFERVRASDNPLIVAEASKSLVDIAKRKADLVKSEHKPLQ